MGTGVDTVVGVLGAAGFEPLSRPLTVADATFDFDAAVMGTGVSHDLVVVASSDGPPKRLARLLSALSRTLDQVGSRRPVSLVLLGEPLDGLAMDDLERHARVINLEARLPTVDQVRRAVAVLMPLALPSTTTRGKDPLVEVAAILGGTVSDEQRGFLDAARFGPDEVRATFRQYLELATNGDDQGTDS